jgi:glutathionylspermidine synthase
MISAPWQLPESELQPLLRELRFRYFKWDLYASGRCLVLPESVVLSRAEHEKAVAVAERFAAILVRLETALPERPDLLGRLGIPPDVIPLVTSPQPLGLQLARYDLFLTPDGRWMVSEFNEDVPGGFNEAVGLPDLLGRRRNGAAFAGDLRQAIVEAFAPYRRVAFVYATGYTEDLQHILIVQQWLEAAGHSTVLGSPAHLRMGWRGPRVQGERCDAVFRFYPGEWFAWLPNRAAWQRALPGLPLMNPIRRLLRQSKRLYAFWRDPSLLDADDLRFLEEHAPATFPFDPDRAAEWTAERSRWVIKHAFGRMGDNVVMGNLVSDKDWHEAMAEASRQPQSYLMQERFEVAPLNENGRTLYPGIGVYLVNHRFAGYYSRAATQPFINHEAYHVATLVEAA